MKHDIAGLPRSAAKGPRAAHLLRAAFEQAGWQVEHAPAGGPDSRGGGGDFIARKKKVAYLVKVKAAPEARGDRLLPLWSQAWLQAVHGASGNCQPLAVVAAPHVPQRVAEQVMDFAAEHAPDGAAGVIDFEGLRLFVGEHLQGLNALPDAPGRRSQVMAHEVPDLFSDLNQWLLKVLLAPLIPEQYLAAPRAEYGGAKELGSAAGVSPMSAFRLVRQLREEGFLAGQGRELRLVRREELLNRWQSAAAVRRVREIPMRFLHRSDARVATKRLLAGGKSGGCLALFAAADALGAGFVQGVPPHAYLPRLDAARLAALKGVVPASPGESPDLLLRQPNAPKSVFRGVVLAKGVPVSDVLQVWLDVAPESARGEEQAAQLRRHILRPLFAE